MMWTQSDIEAMENDDAFMAYLRWWSMVTDDEIITFIDRYGYTNLFHDDTIESVSWEEAEADNYFMEER